MSINRSVIRVPRRLVAAVVATASLFAVADPVPARAAAGVDVAAVQRALGITPTASSAPRRAAPCAASSAPTG